MFLRKAEYKVFIYFGYTRGYCINRVFKYTINRKMVNDFIYEMCRRISLVGNAFVEWKILGIYRVRDG